MSDNINNNSEIMENNAPIVGVSRRRLAFRPQSLNGTLSQSLNAITGEKTLRIGKPCRFVLEPADSVQCKIEQTTSSIIGSSTPDQLSRRFIRRITTWNLNETMIFYEGLKQYGKDFEAIVSLMKRKKIEKDRDQIRSFFFNAFKCWTAAAKIEEDDWSGVPRDARELFVVLNGCEWKKRTIDAKFHPTKFKSLIFDGFASVRVRHRKQLLLIKTPYAPYDKRNAEIPSFIQLQLRPFRYNDRHYVIECKQNPYIVIKININDKIAKVFEFLKKKWIVMESKLNKELNDEFVKHEIKLRPSDGIQLHKVHVEISDDNGPPMLKKDYEEKIKELESSSNVPDTPTLLNKRPTDNTIIRLQGASIKEVFDIDDQTIQTGFTDTDVKNATMLQLFYICGMKEKITLEYEIFRSPMPFQPWSAFISLLNRDYAENASKGLVTPISTEKNKQDCIILPKESQLVQPIENPFQESSRKRRLSKSGAHEKTLFENEDIVLNESQAFIKQWQELKASNSRKPRRIVKSVPANSSIGIGSQSKRQIIAQQSQPTVYMAPSKSETELLAKDVYTELVSTIEPKDKIISHEPIISSTSEHTYKVAYIVTPELVTIVEKGNVVSHEPSSKNAQTIFLQPKAPSSNQISVHASTSLAQPEIPISEGDTILSRQNSTAIDFSSMVVDPSNDQMIEKTQNASEDDNNITIQVLNSGTVANTAPIANDIHATGECSIDGSATVISIHSHDGSPTKSHLPEDVRQLYEMMLQQNSIDYCRNFEQLAKTFESPSKRSNISENTRH